MFLKRSYQKELIDDFSIQDHRIDEALDELRLVNKYLGGYSTSYSGIKYFINGQNNQQLKILDIGSGACDILETIQRKDSRIKVFSLDKNKRICEILINENHGETRNEAIYGDALNLPLKNNSVDIIHSSLFLHHLSEEQIKNIIGSSLIVARKGIIINDLRRSIIAVAAIKFLISLLSKSVLIKNDAPLSVKKAFIKSDLINLLEKSKIKNYKIKRKWAFRWLVIIPKHYDENN